MENKFKVLKLLSLLTQVGLIVIISILISLYLGRIIDKTCGTQYIFTIILIIIGVVSGMINVYKLIMRSIKK